MCECATAHDKLLNVSYESISRSVELQHVRARSIFARGVAPDGSGNTPRCQTLAPLAVLPPAARPRSAPGVLRGEQAVHQTRDSRFSRDRLSETSAIESADTITA